MTLKQNIIYIYFKGKHQVTSKSQYQYNRGQYLYFADLNLPQAFEVHFSNKDKGESKTQIGSDNLVEIPDEYFWNGALQIYAWIYLHSKTTDGETIYEVRIPLTKRAKPTDEEPLPVQQSTIDRAIAELNNAVDITTENANKTDSDKIIISNIKEDVITLKENIDSTATIINQKAQETIDASGRAETSAQNAATSENKALNYSQQAEQSAQSALESKNIAQQKSEVATNASNEALGYRNEALEAKNQAVQVKQNIVDYRDETKGYRDETLTVKNNVQTLKNQIDETAEEIEDISDNVKEDAQSASRSASSANQSSINASQSASQAKKSADDAEESANQAKQNKNQTETFKNQSEEYKTQTETFKNQAEEFKNQTETNVTHYPKIIGEYWYIWDATNGEYINTNVDANGIKGDTGNGIASVALNDDYTLTITFTDDTTYTTSSIRGQQGEKGDTGATGESGVYIGTEEPENEDIKVWIDTDDDGTSEDLVEEIDELKRNIYKPYAVDTTSGSIASFSDGADDLPLKNLVVDINPVQDLHGQDAPYPAGGGKNLFDASNPNTVSGYIGSTAFSTGNDKAKTVYIPIKPNTTYTVSKMAGGRFNLATSDVIPSNGATFTVRQANANMAIKTITSGENDAYLWAWVYFQDTDAVTYEEMLATVQIEEGSTATSYAPYENICPISGWTEVDVEQRGKNLLKLKDGTYTVARATVTVQNGTITVNGESTSGGRLVRLTDTFLLKAGTYNISHGSNTPTISLYLNRADNNTVVGNVFNPITITEDVEVFAGINLQAATYTGQSITPQLELGSTATPYSPYTGRSITIDLGQTVYGAKLYPLEGKALITMAMVDLGTLDWMLYSVAQGNLFRKSIPAMIATPSDGVIRAICSNYKSIKQTLRTNATISSGVATHNIDVIDNRYSDTTAFKQAMQGVQLCYELATPIEIQLSANQINSLLGVNNIWADSGDSEVEYRADTKLYIDKKIAEVLASLA